MTAPFEAPSDSHSRRELQAVPSDLFLEVQVEGGLDDVDVPMRRIAPDALFEPQESVHRGLGTAAAHGKRKMRERRGGLP